MDCPVCHKAMSEEDFGGVKVDVCKSGCKGIWFDWFELSKLDEDHEGLGNSLKDALDNPRAKDDDRGKINCPKCGIPMANHLYQSSKDVTVDECYSCGGFFLDSGELKVIRDSFMDDSQRDNYTQTLLDGVSEFQKEQEDLEKEKMRNAAIRKFTKALRPSRFFKK